MLLSINLSTSYLTILRLIAWSLIVSYFIFYESLLCYTVQYSTVLHYTIRYYTILYYTILYYTILYYTTLHYTTLNLVVYVYLTKSKINFLIFYYILFYYTEIGISSLQSGILSPDRKRMRRAGMYVIQYLQSLLQKIFLFISQKTKNTIHGFISYNDDKLALWQVKTKNYVNLFQ